MARVFGGQREAVLARELTKAFETVRKAPLQSLAEWVEQDQNQQKGEMVVLVAGAPEKDEDGQWQLDRLLAALVDELPVKQAASIAARITGLNRNRLYKQALDLKGKH